MQIKKIPQGIYLAGKAGSTNKKWTRPFILLFQWSNPGMAGHYFSEPAPGAGCGLAYCFSHALICISN